MPLHADQGRANLTHACLLPAESCCCNHGGRCTCAHKKEVLQLTPVPESDSDDKDNAPTAKGPRGGVGSRRRANTVQLDGVLAFDDHGHHKPTHKHAKASLKCGPYQLDRANSAHVAGTLGRRSVDSDSPGDSGSTDSPVGTSGSPRDQCQADSEEASPLMTGSSSFADLNGRLPPLDLSGIEYPPYMSNGYDNLFGSLSDHEPPMFSAGLSATPVDWSHYDGLEFASRAADFAPSNYSQPQSYGTFDLNGSEQPTLTTNTSTSGEVSEIEDFLPNNIEDFDDAGFGTSTTSSSFNLAQMHGNLLSRADLTPLSYNDFKLLKAGNKFLPTPASLAGEEPVLAATSSGGIANYQLVDDDTALWMSDYAHGLPGLPNLTDSPDPNLPNFWEAQ